MEEEKQHADTSVKSGDAGSRGSLMKHLAEQEKEKYKQLLQKYAGQQPVICQAAREGNLDDVKFFVEVLILQHICYLTIYDYGLSLYSSHPNEQIKPLIHPCC